MAPPTITNLILGKSKVEFDISGIDVGFLNAIRRVILSEIPNVAAYFDSYNIENSDIRFIKNTSVLHNEFTGHRISLLPLCFDKKEIASYDPNDYKFVLNEEGIKTVTTKDIKIYDKTGNLCNEAFHRKIFPPDASTGHFIIITKLKKPEEKLHVEFVARKSTSKDSGSGFSPVSTACFYNIVDDAQVDAARALITDPKELNKFDTLTKYRLFKKNEYGEPSAFHFIIESECRLQPRYIFKKAIDVLKDKLTNIIGKCKIEIINSDTNLYAVTIEEENHTLGNLLQTSIFNDYVRPKKTIDYVGYYQPHPLVESIVFKIRFFKEVNVESVQSFLQDAIDKTINRLDSIPMESLKVSNN